jgi:hypothetical protein
LVVKALEMTHCTKSSQRFHVAALCVAIFVSSLFLFTFKRNVEFQGDDDYMYFWDFALYSKIRFLPEHWTRAGLVQFGKLTIKPFLHAPHNLMPAFAFGCYYRLLDAIGVPFSVRVIHSPMALMSALTCSLFFLLLVMSGFEIRWALSGTLLLMFSPIFSVAARAIAQYFTLAIPFSHVLALVGLQSLSDRKSSKVFAGLVLLNVALTDMLFFLTIPALAVAYALRDAPPGLLRSSPKVLLATIWENMRPLREKVVCLPALVAAVWWVLVTAGSFIAAAMHVWHPTTPLSRLFIHSGMAGSMLFGEPTALHNYMVYLFGDAFLYIFVLLIAAYVLFLRGKVSGFLWAYAVIAGAGYGILWYVLTGKHDFVMFCYQIYVLVPFLLLTLCILRSLRLHYPKSGPLVLAVLLVMGVSAVAGHLSCVWRLPLALSPSAYTQTLQGMNNPNRGTKAIGYLVRQILNSTWTTKPTQPVRIYMSPRSSSLVAFSGLMMNGAYYAKQHGARPNMTVENLEDVRKVVPIGESQIPPLCMILDFRSSTGRPDSLLGQPAPDTVARYDVTSGGRVIASLFVIPSSIITREVPPPGTYSFDSLDFAFYHAYHTLMDFFPFP